MRRLLEDAVIKAYSNGLDEVSGETSGWPCKYEYNAKRSKELDGLLQDLLSGGTSITEYVTKLSDAELLSAYTNQCCLKFR